MNNGDRTGVALEFMMRASRDTFRLCAKLATEMADSIENGEVRVLDTPTALRMLALMFVTSAKRE